MIRPDQDVFDRIEQLAHEEHALYDRESQGRASARERERLKEIQAQLDQCYDLLRRRRARRAAGLESDDAVAPVPPAVEGSAT
jgi:hypothetical protein